MSFTPANREDAEAWREALGNIRVASLAVPDAMKLAMRMHSREEKEEEEERAKKASADDADADAHVDVDDDDTTTPRSSTTFAHVREALALVTEARIERSIERANTARRAASS